MLRSGMLGVIATVLASGTALAQTGSITGRITSTDGAAPIVGAHVVVVGTPTGAIAHDDGSYTIRVNPGTYTVRATRIGFSPDSVTGVVVTSGGTVTANIQLKAAATKLNEVVVVGYGSEAQRRITGSVASVSDSAFNPGRVVAPQELIQGKVPGVQVVGSNEPGGSIKIRVRGGSSVTSSNEPLYVIDGVPLVVGQEGVSAGRDPLNFLNPNDVENITVLKDASATAIYGSRGANGVVIITTKSGKSAGPSLSYTGSVSRSSVISEPQMLSASQYRAAVAQYGGNNAKVLGTANTNWLDAVEQNATGQEHALALAGRNQDMNYRLSLGYLDQGGVLDGSTAKRVSTAASYNDALLNHRLDVQANIRGARTDDWFTPGSVLGNAVTFDPTQAIRTSTGAYTEFTDPLAPSNPVSQLALISDKATTYRGLGNIQGTYHFPFLDGLSGTMNVGYDIAKADHTIFDPSVEHSQLVRNAGGNITRAEPTLTNTVVDAYGTYAHNVGDRSHIDLTAGYSFNRVRGDSANMFAQGLATDLLGPNGVPAATTSSNNIWDYESRLASFFGRVNYSLNDRYLIAASVRRDGSSKFGPTHQWGVFPSLGLGWRIVDESFMKRFPTISDLKLRYSYGVNGNQAFPDYEAYSAYTIGDAKTQAQFGNGWVTTVRPSAVDPNIRWEQTTSNDFGLDYGLWNNRITGTVDYYTKKTKDLIFNVPVAAGTNLSNYVTTNIGSLQNKGLELGLDARIFDGADNGFRWDATFTASTNTNKLLKITGLGSEQILTGGIAGGVGNNIEVLQPGLPINSFFVYRHQTAGGKAVTGDTTDLAMYRDVNGDGVINQNDRVAFHSPNPKWIFGHTSNMGWGNFDASFTMRAYRGNYVYNNVASNLGHYDAVAGPVPVNLSASVLKYNFVKPQYFSDLYVEDGSFVKMDNISLGYTFRGLTSSLRQVRVFGTIQNVFTITNYSGVDPEVGINGIDNNVYPRSRTYSIGTNIGF